MQGSRLADLFYARGWVTVAEALLFFWCVAIFIFKIRKLRRQKESMLFDLLPNEISDEIAIRNVHEFSRNVRSLPVKPGESFLVNRVLRGLEHFAIRRSTPEVGTLLSSQSDIDANAVSSSYTLLKVFIWAIPILGFIGTVQGLGDSVGAFGGSIENANDIAALKGSLSSIIAGLAVAFDTTLVALIMSVPLTYFASSMQKSEEDLLNWVDEYTNENLLKRLADGAGGTPVALDSKQALRAAIDAAMADHHAELEAWNRKLQNIGSNITTQVIDGWSGMLADLRSVQDQLTTTRQTQLADHQQTAAQLQQALAALSDRAHHIEAQTTTSLQQTAASMQTQFAAMEQALSSLNRVLTELGEKQIVIQKEAPRRGWFSRK
jgi:biopolymer transport protein ExbB/TolQ